MVRLSRESSGGGRASKVSIPKYALDPDLWYSGGRVTVHCWVLLWRNGLMWDGIRNGLDMELPEAILVGKGRGPFTVGMTWRKTQNKSRFRPDNDALIKCIYQWRSDDLKLFKLEENWQRQCEWVLVSIRYRYVIMSWFREISSKWCQFFCTNTIIPRQKKRVLQDDVKEGPTSAMRRSFNRSTRSSLVMWLNCSELNQKRFSSPEANNSFPKRQKPLQNLCARWKLSPFLTGTSKCMWKYVDGISS